jgi:nitrite reductase/ring-hydroxylating ferredoxin subunit
LSTHPKDADGFYQLAQLDQVPQDDMLQVFMEDDGVEVDIALTRVEGHLYAFRDICPHMAFPLSVGYIEGTKLTCVGHAWTFDLKSGRALMPPIKKSLMLYETRLDGQNNVWVKVDPLF